MAADARPVFHGSQSANMRLAGSGGEGEVGSRQVAGGIETDTMVRCSAINSAGLPCNGRAMESGLCGMHNKAARADGRV